jgi:hypothetical protein
MPFKLLLPALVILAQATALADGGTVQLRREAGDLVITVFTSPSPLSVGPVDISVLLQNRDSLEAVLDAKIALLLHRDAVTTDDSEIEFEAGPTREQARNKLLYAAPVMLSQPGKWQIAVTVLRNGKKTDAVGILEVMPAPGRAVSYAGYIAFPPVMIGLFMLREGLIRRRSRRIA